MQPTVKNQKVYVVIESVLESGGNPATLHTYLRANHFTGQAEIRYDANYNQGGVARIITREHIPVTMAELDRLLADRSNGNNS